MKSLLLLLLYSAASFAYDSTDVPDNLSDYRDMIYPGLSYLENKYNSNVSSFHDVGVAVIDSGINSQHIFLNEKVLDGFNIRRNSIIESRNSIDGFGHGTAVSGVIVANHHSKVIPYVALDFKGSGHDTDVNAAIRIAAQNPNVQIINLSLGGDSNSIEQQNSIFLATHTYKKPVIIATGNSSGLQPKYPARYAIDNPYIIAVASEQANTGRLDNFSNHCGDTAEHCMSADGKNVPVFVMKNHHSYIGNMSGTSFSTPTVTGLISLIISSMDKAQIKQQGAIASVHILENIVADLNQTEIDMSGHYVASRDNGLGNVSTYMREILKRIISKNDDDYVYGAHLHKLSGDVDTDSPLSAIVESKFSNAVVSDKFGRIKSLNVNKYMHSSPIQITNQLMQHQNIISLKKDDIFFNVANLNTPKYISGNSFINSFKFKNNQHSVHGIYLASRYNISNKIDLIVGSAYERENNGFMFTPTSGSFNVRSTEYHIYGIGINYKLGSNFMLKTNADFGYVNVSTASNSIFRSFHDIQVSSYSVALNKKITPKDDISIRFSSPLSVSSGSVDINTPIFGTQGASMYLENTSNWKSADSEISMTYIHDFDNNGSQFGVSLSASRNPKIEFAIKANID